MVTALLTNDDGIDADGLARTREALVAAGFAVLVVAPDGNRSATGHRVTVRDEVTLRLVREDAAGQEWSCSGTPADCVRAAFFTAGLPRVDVVVSGANHGPNIGEDVFYSGTVAAAVEAALLGLPALAVSQAGADDPTGFLAARPSVFPHGAFVASLAREVAERAEPRVLLNVNLPAAAGAEAVLAPLSSRDWTTTGNAARREGTTVHLSPPWVGEPVPVVSAGEDAEVLARGAISVTPLLVRGGLVDLTDRWRTEHRGVVARDVRV